MRRERRIGRFYQSEMDSVDESSSSPLPKIDLQQVHITNGHFVYDDRQQDLYTAIDGFFLHIDGLLTQRGNKLDVETGFFLDRIP